MGETARPRLHGAVRLVRFLALVGVVASVIILILLFLRRLYGG
jgi:hypothetical protein